MGRTKNPTIYSYQIGNPTSINRAYNYINARDGGQGPAFFWNNYWTSFRPGPPGPVPPVLNDKIVALLDFDYSLDLNIKNTLEFYFTNYSTIFQPFPIENTLFSTPITLDLLNQYYAKGYKYFILTTHSGVIIDLISWFNEHPDAVGYTCYSQSDLVNVPKNIYNLTPPNSSKMTLYSYDCIDPYNVVYFWWNASANEIASIDRYYLFKKICEEEGKTFIDISFTAQTSITTEYVNNVMNNMILGGQNASIIISAESLTSKLYNCFNNTTRREYNIYNTGVFPVFDNIESQQYFVDILYIINTSQANLCSSYLWKVGYQSLGSAGYGTPVLNCMSMAYGSQKNVIVANSLPANNDVLYFNYVTKFAENYSIEILSYTSKDGKYEFVPNKIYYDGTDDKIFVTDVPEPVNVPVTIQPIPAPSGPKKKAIALLDTINYESFESIVYPIYYYTTTTNLFEPLTIINTSEDKQETIDKLNKYYAEGYTIFLGFSNSNEVYNVLEWFDAHPDAIGISVSSSANSLSTIHKNIYRLQPSDQYLVDGINEPLQKSIDEGGRIFYVYSEGQVAAVELLSFFQEKYGTNNIIPYAAKSDSSNLTQTDLYNFFITQYNATSIDTIVLYLFIGDQRQVYINAFTQPLYIQTSQYEITGGVNLQIDLATTTLNGLYNVVTYENITKSELINQGLEYFKNGFSVQILNALYMVTSFVNNYDVLSLASYNSCLQFNEYNDIAYGSIAVFLYQDGLYDYKYIYSKDPIYGQLYFTKV